jgi:hypothetical protein
VRFALRLVQEGREVRINPGLGCLIHLNNLLCLRLIKVRKQSLSPIALGDRQARDRLPPFSLEKRVEVVMVQQVIGPFPKPFQHALNGKEVGAQPPPCERIVFDRIA